MLGMLRDIQLEGHIHVTLWNWIWLTMVMILGVLNLHNVKDCWCNMDKKLQGENVLIAAVWVPELPENASGAQEPPKHTWQEITCERMWKALIALPNKHTNSSESEPLPNPGQLPSSMCANQKCIRRHVRGIFKCIHNYNTNSTNASPLTYCISTCHDRSAYLSTYLPMYLPIYLSTYLSAYLSI